ncbi:amino acid ABC transporter permease [Nesterenkonia lutea]|uniref:Polar amino acid transport system permease protein/cystine transport system permease protein n=1 Tax=Nesterenkonia lutea TaxID=272919 RepID=A0ABR9JEL5_9MICC|nr:amino acid ABC transporter permease [Nesterenkonia lutea]MBE1524377.1 polar amino acid transport system permease protein/cystine transport system permease protein [Nesterenkonia lutea]
MLEADYVLEGLWVTLQIWLGAFLLSAVLAIPVAMLRRSRNPVANFLGALWAWIARGIPPIAWLIIIYFGISLGVISQVPVLAAIVGLGIVNSAYIGDSIRSGLDSVSDGQREAAASVALTRTDALVRVVLPQAIPVMLASTAAYSITLLKNTAIASIIGANEMVFYAYNAVQVGADPIMAFLTIGIVYLIITVPIGMFARWLDSRVKRGSVKVAY